MLCLMTMIRDKSDTSSGECEEWTNLVDWGVACRVQNSSRPLALFQPKLAICKSIWSFSDYLITLNPQNYIKWSYTFVNGQTFVGSIRPFVHVLSILYFKLWACGMFKKIPIPFSCGWKKKYALSFHLY